MIGGLLTGALGLGAWLATDDLGTLAVMGSGYGTLQHAVSAAGDAMGPSILVLAIVALGKMVTTSLTIGSGGSGGVFGPAMVIGGTLGALVGSVFHQWIPDVVPNVGPFTIVGMAGFFAGAANTPISTLIMVGDMTGNYSLLLPSMLVVSMALFIAHRWTIYPEQVGSRVESPAHRGEFMIDVLEDLRVQGVYSQDREVHRVRPETPLREIMELITKTSQHYFPVVDAEDRLVGIFSLNDLREVLYDVELAGLVVAQDLSPERVLWVTPEDTLHRALGLVTLQNIDEIPVVSSETEKRLLGMLSRRDIIAAYHQRVVGAGEPA
jgi:CIC family chloride channel protein